MSIGGSRLIRTGTCYLFPPGGMRKPGTLLLFEDRLVHVASPAMWLGPGLGLLVAAVMIGLNSLTGALGGGLGALVATGIATHRAPRRAARGGAGVVEMPFTRIAAVRPGNLGRTRKGLEVRLIDAAPIRFAVKLHQWESDLARYLPATVNALELTS